MNGYLLVEPKYKTVKNMFSDETVSAICNSKYKHTKHLHYHVTHTTCRIIEHNLQ